MNISTTIENTVTTQILSREIRKILNKTNLMYHSKQFKCNPFSELLINFMRVIIHLTLIKFITHLLKSFIQKIFQAAVALNHIVLLRIANLAAIKGLRLAKISKIVLK